MLEFQILGPLEVVDGDRPVALGGPKQRALLVVLLLHRGEAVSIDRLIDALWGERPPATPAKTAQVYVSNLRKVLGDGVLVTRGHGYLLATEPGDVDLDRFQALVTEGREAWEAGNARRASHLIRDALALWRGPALADFAFEQFAQGEAGRLEEERLAAVEDRIEADLALGRHAALVGELVSLVREHPLRERPRAQLMLALYRSGRQADALERYQQARRDLLEQLGIEPGQALKQLERGILQQDPSLQQPPRGAPIGRTARRGRTLVRAGGAVVLLLAVIAAALITRGRRQVAIPSRHAGALVAVDPVTDRLLAAVPSGRSPGDIAIGGGSLWVLDTDDQTIAQIDPQTRRVVHTFSAGVDPVRLAYGDGSLWVGSNGPFRSARGNLLTSALNPDLANLTKLDPSVSTLPAKVIKLPVVQAHTTYDEGNDAHWARKLAVGNGAVWVASSAGSVYRIDPTSGRLVATIRGLRSGSLALDPTGVWAVGADTHRGYLSLISARTDAVVIRMTVPSVNIGAATVDDGALWFTGHDQRRAVTSGQESLWRIQLGNTTSVNLGLGAGTPGIAVGAGSVWVINDAASTVTRINPVTLRAVKVIALPGTPRDIAFDHGVVWVSVTSA